LIVVSVISGYLMMSGVLPYLRPGWNPDYERLPLFLAFLASTFATLPAIGLYFSLSQRRFLVAWTLTLLAGLLLPELVVWKWIRVLAILSGLNPNVDSDVAAISMVLRCGAQLLLAGGALVLLLRNLKLRRFAVAS
jgi:ABC-type transport system involved in multi-copper enzyme maturation permease subunit